MNILYISLFPVSKNDPAAGGQIAYYYVSKIQKNPDNNLKILCSVPPQDKKFVEESEKEFDCLYFDEPEKNVLQKIKNKLNLKKGQMDSRVVKKFIEGAKNIKNSGFIADYVIFDWENSSYIFDDIKKLFPEAKYTVIEQDVQFQSFLRYYKSQKNLLKKLYYKILYKNCIKLEKNVFSKVNHIGVLTQKDKELVKTVYTQKDAEIVVPYFYDYSYLNMDLQRNNDILFFGYMKRRENIEAVTWFINEVLPELKSLRFVIIGGGVTEEVKNLESEKVHITGFQTNEEIGNWFSKSLCMIVPLLHGAGVKIKVLESLNAGLPVLTNKIGIEGIPALDQKDYLHCEKSEDYINSINYLLENKDQIYSIGKNARNLINKCFNYKNSSYIL